MPCPRCRVPRPTAKHVSTRDVPVGHWTSAQARFNRRAHLASPILVHAGVGQGCRVFDEESCPISCTSVVTDVAAVKVSHSIGYDMDATTFPFSGVVMDIAPFKVSHSVGIDIDTSTAWLPTTNISTCDIQPNQPSRPTRLDMEDPHSRLPSKIGTFGIEDHISRHLRLNAHGAVDADGRFAAHLSGKGVRARLNQNPVDGAVVDGCSELRYGAYTVPVTRYRHGTR